MQSDGRTNIIPLDRSQLVREPPLDHHPYVREPPMEAVWSRHAEETRRRLTGRTADIVRHVCLVEEHRDLDEMISFLSADPHPDDALITRLKKRRLAIKDEIARIESPG